MPHSYHLPPGYVERLNPAPFDDTPNRDEWQREVYEHAATLFHACKLSTVLDVGCGSGYKLVQNFPPSGTLGIDSPATVQHLRQTYPDREWLSFPDVDYASLSSEMLICADVIEHIPEPTSFLHQLLTVRNVRYYIFSTPDRLLVRPPGDLGPPANPSHVREWSRAEFTTFISQFLDVRHVTYSNLSQGTILVIATPR